MSMREIYKRVKGKWMKHAPDLYWGDDLDVRYYLISELKKLRNKKILDIGCGAGIILSELNGNNEKIGLDASKKELKIAKEMNGDSKFVSADVCNLPFKGNEFDIVIAAHVLPGYDYIMKNEGQARKKMMSEIRRVLKHNGTLFLTTPNSQSSYYRKQHKIKRDELCRLLKDFDYQIYGYNPLPRFLPPKFLVKVPGIHIILNSLVKKKFFGNKCRAFYVEAMKNNKTESE